jgi:DNA-binding CsgD family transcriptional regulator
MRLSHRDFDLTHEALLDLYEHRNLGEFRRDLPGIFLKLIPNEHFCLPSYSIDPMTRSAKLIDYIESGVSAPAEIIPQWEAHFWEHPFTKYFSQGGTSTALILADFLTCTQLRNSSLWDLVCRVLQYNRLICLPVAWTAGMAAIGLGRRGRHFTERDRLILNLLRPHFNRAYKNAESTTARRNGDGPFLSEHGLLPREREVAHWIAQGKSNVEIAMILQVSPRTVEKHMERILAKLKVENRTTAAVLICRCADYANEPPNQLSSARWP